jgi:hypothetical protein
MICGLILLIGMGGFAVKLIGTDAVAQNSAETATSDTGASESEEEQEFDVIIINYDGYKKNRKGPVKFTHKKHARDYGISCWNCHHSYEDDDKEKPNLYSPWSGETDTCDTCHDPQETDMTDIKLQRAFHMNCKGCHKSLAQQKKKTGEFRKCTGCHDKMT